MKKITLTILIFTLCITGFTQQQKYGTKIICGFSFEKFPLQFFHIAAKSMWYKNSYTGKLTFYKEFNQVGQATGLQITMDDNGIYPAEAEYIYKGNSIYRVTFFANSKIAQTITNDEYNIVRTLKDEGGYTEEIEIYNNGNLVSINGVKQSISETNYRDSLLDGHFKFLNNQTYTIEGIAEKGIIREIKQYHDVKYLMYEITFTKDSVIIKTPFSTYDDVKGFTYEKYLKINDVSGTNSKYLNSKYLNDFLIPIDIDDIKKLVVIAIQKQPSSENSIGLLVGDFDFEKDNIHFIGTAKEGEIQKLTIIFLGVKKSKTVISKIFGNEMEFNYNTIKFTLDNATKDKYYIQYLLSETNEIKYEDESNWGVKKITKLQSLSKDNNFAVYNNDNDLKEILINMNFFKK